jgi:hypothetical protein
LASVLSVELIPLKWLGFWATSISGVMIFMSDATRFYNNPAFVAKVVLLSRAIAFAMLTG